ncbi:MAG TPA: 3-oxo-tetronate kinase [Longimicrobiaceae bacterium]|nr:3-oxo-tetronate kinase [Longimicrobiaceae bacterium]
MEEPLLFGAVADDYTGAADLASMLREQGMRTGLLFGPLPDSAVESIAGRHQALVIALKSRSPPSGSARRDSLGALEQLRRLGARQLYFKYCSTFDSTLEGNIGPVIDVLMSAIDTDFTVAVPALPVNGRTQYQGYLFVGDSLLSDTHMRDHPVTPMTESNLVRHLQKQTSRRVGLIAHSAVREGVAAIESEIERCRRERVEIALVDAITDDDLNSIAEAVADLPLITGGSGLGMTLPAAWRRRGLLAGGERAGFGMAGRTGRALVISGSCSSATLDQLRNLQDAGGDGGLRLDVAELFTGDGAAVVNRLLDAIAERLRTSRWALLYSSASPLERRELLAAAAARAVDSAELSRRIEAVMGEVARRAVDAFSIDTLILAGGETTGAVTQALGITGVEIGPALEPGVPLARSLGDDPVSLVFKSGNFGAPDFFITALRQLGIADLEREMGRVREIPGAAS